MEIRTLLFEDLVIDGQFQSRIGVNKDIVKEYADVVAEGVSLPPVEVVQTSQQLIVVDGFHRIEAYRSIGRDRIEAKVHQGDQGFALRLAIRANQGHGLRLSRLDKRHCVEMALGDFELSCLSDLEIAKLCGVSNTLVSRIRQDVGHTKSLSKFARKTYLKSVPEVSILTPLVRENSLGSEAGEGVDYDPRDDALQELVEENDQLKDRLAVAAMDATEDEKALAASQIADLREQVRLLEIDVKGLTISRNQFQAENAQLKRQCFMQKEQIKRLNEQLASRAAGEEPMPV